VKRGNGGGGKELEVPISCSGGSFKRVSGGDMLLVGRKVEKGP